MIAAQQAAVESRRQTVQAGLDARKSAKERNRLGQFATPHGLACEIADFVRETVGGELPAVRFADPAIGTGSFYSAALQAFGTDKIKCALGIEVDAGFAEAARALWGSSGLEVVAADFTQWIACARQHLAPNLILANPPYVRHHHLRTEDKLRLQALVRRTAGVDVNGLAGLYVYFLLLATEWMADAGYAAWLVPSEFMDVNYGAALKQFLLERVSLLRVHRFDLDEVQFDDALVSSVVLVFRKALPAPDSRVDFSFGGTRRSPRAHELVSIDQLRTARKWSVFPAHEANDRSVSTVHGALTLGDLFRIRRGIATGSNTFFIRPRDEALRLGWPANCIRPILPSPRHLKVTCIESDDDGYPRLECPLCLIDCDLPEDVVELQHPALWLYLRSAETLGVKDRYLVRKRSPWYRQEQRAPAPYLCTYMGRGSNDQRPFRFLWNQSQAIATNLYLMLYPQNALAAMLRHFPERAGAVWELLGQVTGNELRGEGRVYGGGLHKIEPNELARVSAQLFHARWPELAETAEHQRRLFE